MKVWKYRHLLLVLKVGIFLFMSLVIYRRLTGVNDAGASWADFAERFHEGVVSLFVGALILMPVNWGIEIIKWQRLLSRSYPIRLSDAMRSVLGGLAIGFATPARVGEFAGRVMFLKSGTRIDGIYLSAVGGLAQSLVTILSALFFMRYYSTARLEYIRGFYGDVVMAVVAATALIAYLRYDRLIHLLHRFSRRLHPYMMTEEHVPGIRDKMTVLALSALRYSVYMGQYYLLLRFVGLHAPTTTLLAAISLVLFMQSISPLIPLMDIPVRGGMLLLLCIAYKTQVVGVLMVPLILWTINLLAPALLGYWYIAKLKADAKE